MDNGSGQEFRLSVSGMPGRSYQVQVSPALPPSWETVTTLTSDAEGKAEYADPNPSTAGSRYFRCWGLDWASAATLVRNKTQEKAGASNPEVVRSFPAST